MIGTVVSGCVMLVAGFICGGIAKLYFSFKAFVSEVIEKSLPPELIESATAKFPPWRKWFARQLLLFGRTKLTGKIFKVITAPETIVALLIKIGIFSAIAIVLSALNFIAWYFGGIEVYVTVPATAIGVVSGYFILKATVDRFLNYLVELISGFSTKTIRQGAERIGLELTDEFSSTQKA